MSSNVSVSLSFLFYTFLRLHLKEKHVKGEKCILQLSIMKQIFRCSDILIFYFAYV